MNTTTAETEFPSRTKFYKSEVRRMGMEMERILSETEASRLRCKRLSAETDENLTAIRAMLDRRVPVAPPHP